MKFSEEIIKIFDDLGKRFGVAIDWSNETIMPYLNGLIDRFIKYEIATSIILVVIGIVECVAGVLLAKYAWKHRRENPYFGDIDEGITWQFVIGIAGIVVGVIMVWHNCFEICEALYLPEKAVYDYVSSIIQNS